LASRSASEPAVSARRRSSSFSRCVSASTQLLPLRIVEQVVLQVGIAVDDPDVAQHLEQHPCRAAGAPLAAQFVQQLPHRRAEQAVHDLAIGERRVVVRDLAQPRAGGVRIRERDEGFGDDVHDVPMILPQRTIDHPWSA
jgi:hypothetical protein